MKTPVRRYLIATLVLLLVHAGYARAATPQDVADPPGPSFKEVLSLQSVGAPRIAPDGRMIAYTVRTTEWDENRYDQEIWLFREGEPPFQLTRTTDGSSTGQRWSPDGRWLAFLADRGEKQQIYLISPHGGDARQLTSVKDGISNLQWSPDGATIAFTATDAEGKEMEARKDQYGAFAIEDADFRMSHLWVVEVEGEGEPRRLTEGDDFTVGGFAWSPDGEYIAFEHRPEPTPDASGKSDISVVEVASGAVRPLVSEPGGDYGPIWSPDGRWILVNSMLQDSAFHRNRYLVRVSAAGGEPEVLTDGFDENPSAFAWTRDGIWFLAAQRTSVRIFKLNAQNKRIEPVSGTPEMVFAADISTDGSTLAFLGQSATTLGEIYRTSVRRFRPERVTNLRPEREVPSARGDPWRADGNVAPGARSLVRLPDHSVVGQRRSDLDAELSRLRGLR